VLAGHPASRELVVPLSSRRWRAMSGEGTAALPGGSQVLRVGVLPCSPHCPLLGCPGRQAEREGDADKG